MSRITTAAPARGKPAAPAVAAAAQKPIVFLNPNVMAPALRVQPEQTSRNPQPGVVSLRDVPAEALAHLLTKADALLVCTANLWTGRSPEDYLVQGGLRGHQFATGWFTNPDRPGRARAVEEWLTTHGRPPAIVIDEAPRMEDAQAIGGAIIVSISIPAGASLTIGACDAALVMLRKRTA